MGSQGRRASSDTLQRPYYPAARSGQDLAFSGSGSFTAALFEAIAVAVHLEDMYVMDRPGEQCAG